MGEGALEVKRDEGRKEEHGDAVGEFTVSPEIGVYIERSKKNREIERPINRPILSEL